jgi:predicted dehydrogenase
MKVLIAGYGSIARKHAAALKKTDPSVKLSAYRPTGTNALDDGLGIVSSPEEAKEFDFIIVSNPTSLHEAVITDLLPLKKPMFIEKPPFHSLDAAHKVLSLLDQETVTYTAFNLRFLECLAELKKIIASKKINEVNVYCGSYLPSWRPGNFRESYSANESMGGGVHLDLIHELDYVRWIFGEPLTVRKTLRRESSLEISASDYANYLLEYPGHAVNVILNYYRRDPKRTCEVVMDDTTVLVNLLENSISSCDGTRLFHSAQTVQDTYTEQMKYFLNCLKENQRPFNSLEESCGTLKIAL